MKNIYMPRPNKKHLSILLVLSSFYSYNYAHGIEHNPTIQASNTWSISQESTAEANESISLIELTNTIKNKVPQLCSRIKEKVKTMCSSLEQFYLYKFGKNNGKIFKKLLTSVTKTIENYAIVNKATTEKQVIHVNGLIITIEPEDVKKLLNEQDHRGAHASQATKTKITRIHDLLQNPTFATIKNSLLLIIAQLQPEDHQQLYADINTSLENNIAEQLTDQEITEIESLLKSPAYLRLTKNVHEFMNIIMPELPHKISSYINDLINKQ